MESILKGLPEKEKTKEAADKELDLLKKQEVDQKKKIEAKGKLNQYRDSAASYGKAAGDVEKYKKII